MFKRCLLIGLEGDADLTGDGYITGSELGIYLSEKVVNCTHRRQHPQYGEINHPDLDRGDFIFVPAEIQQEQAVTAKERQEKQGVSADGRKQLQEESKATRAGSRSEGMNAAPSQKDRDETAKQFEERLRQEAAKRKALEEELKRIKSESKRKAESSTEAAAKDTDGKRLAHVRKTVATGDIRSGPRMTRWASAASWATLAGRRN